MYIYIYVCICMYIYIYIYIYILSFSLFFHSTSSLLQECAEMIHEQFIQAEK